MSHKTRFWILIIFFSISLGWAESAHAWGGNVTGPDAPPDIDDACELRLFQQPGGSRENDPCVIDPNIGCGFNAWSHNSLACTMTNGNDHPKVLLLAPERNSSNPLDITSIRAQTFFIDYSVGTRDKSPNSTADLSFVGWPTMWNDYVDAESDSCRGDRNADGPCTDAANPVTSISNHTAALLGQEGALGENSIVKTSGLYDTNNWTQNGRVTVLPPWGNRLPEGFSKPKMIFDETLRPPWQTIVESDFCKPYHEGDRREDCDAECFAQARELCDPEAQGPIVAFYLTSGRTTGLHFVDIEIFSLPRLFLAVSEGSRLSLVGVDIVTNATEILFEMNHEMLSGHADIGGQTNSIRGTVRDTAFLFSGNIPSSFSPSAYFVERALSIHLHLGNRPLYRFSDTPLQATTCETDADSERHCILPRDTSRLIYALDPEAGTVEQVKTDRLDNTHTTFTMEENRVYFYRTGQRILMPTTTEAMTCFIIDDLDSETVDMTLALCPERLRNSICTTGLSELILYTSERQNTPALVIQEAGSSSFLVRRTGTDAINRGNTYVGISGEEIDFTFFAEATHCSFDRENCTESDDSMACPIDCKRELPFAAWDSGSAHPAWRSSFLTLKRDGTLSPIEDQTKRYTWTTDTLDRVNKKHYTSAGRFWLHECQTHSTWSISKDECVVESGYERDGDRIVRICDGDGVIVSADGEECVCENPEAVLTVDSYSRQICVVSEVIIGDDDDDDDDVIGDDDDDDDVIGDDDDDDSGKTAGDDDDDIDLGDDDDDDDTNACSAMDRLMGRCDDEETTETEGTGISTDEVTPLGSSAGSCSLAAETSAQAAPILILLGTMLATPLVMRTRRRDSE